MINYLFTKTPLVFFVQSFWRDEAFTYILAKQNLFRIISLTIKDFNPPFYYFIIHYWMQVFGSSEISLRLFSLICYWGIVYVGFLFLKNIFKLSLKKSFLYLIFFIFNPLLVYYAFEARMYTLFTLLSGLSFYFFYQRKKNPFIITTIIGLYTHYFMIFVILGQLFFIFLVKEKKWTEYLKPLVISMISFTPWFFFLLLNKPIFSQSFWVQKPSALFFLESFGKIYTGYESNIYPLADKFVKKIVFYLNIVLFLITITGVVKIINLKKKKEQQIFLLLFIWGVITPLVIGLISFIKSIYLPRYLIFATFGQLILVIFILSKLIKKSTVFFFILLFLLTFFYNKDQVKHRRKANFAKIIREIKNISNKNDLLYVINELDYFTAKYYFDEKRVYIYKKTYQEIPDYVGKILIPDEAIIARLPIYPKKAFILKNEKSYDIQAMY